MKTTITALCNQKGGVGKTTSCLNLGVGLAQEGKKVLLVDCDPQGSLTISTGCAQPDSLQDTLSTAMLAKMMDTPYDVSRAILRHGEGVDIPIRNKSIIILKSDVLRADSAVRDIIVLFRFRRQHRHGEHHAHSQRRKQDRRQQDNIYPPLIQQFSCHGPQKHQADRIDRKEKGNVGNPSLVRQDRQIGGHHAVSGAEQRCQQHKAEKLHGKAVQGADGLRRRRAGVCPRRA